jgi:hypothetical protein
VSVAAVVGKGNASVILVTEPHQLRPLKERKGNTSLILVTEPDGKCISAHAQRAKGKDVTNTGHRTT